MIPETTLTPEERAEILAEWKRLAAEPRPKPRQPWGCATFFVATLLFLVVRQLPLPPWLQATLLWILGLAIAGGFFFGVFVGSGKFAHDSARANESIDWLAANPDPGDTAARRRHAVTMLFYSSISDDGPTTSSTFDPGEARKRLGPNLPYVLAVERALAADDPHWKVFDGPDSKNEG